MHTKTTIATTAAAALAVTGIGIGIAHAATTQASPAISRAAAATDTDTLQQGDQTTPDHPSAFRSSTGKAVGHAAAITTSRAATGPVGSTAENAGETGAESAGETQQESESVAANDGPGGGHQDPAGDVQHEGGNNEQ